MKEWEKDFRSVILERGWDYAQSGAVTDLEKSDNTVSALVRGSEYYKVQINYADNEVIDGYCTCPYAAGGEKKKKRLGSLTFFSGLVSYD